VTVKAASARSKAPARRTAGLFMVRTSQLLLEMTGSVRARADLA
jgi:hypothetical protein